MASVLTQISPFNISNTTTCPVILKGRDSIDYVMKKFKTKSSASIKLRHLVKIDGTNIDTVDINGAGELPLGIVPDSVDNRKLLASQNAGVWDYDTAFSDGSLIDVAIPLKALLVSVVLAASNAVNIGSRIKGAASGCAALMATTNVRNAAGDGTTAITEDIAIGKAFSKTTSGTGTQIIAAALFP